MTDEGHDILRFAMYMGGIAQAVQREGMTPPADCVVWLCGYRA
jgi:hypothetical protein